MNLFSKSTTSAFLATLLFASLPAFAQLTSGNIVGTVFDQSGATIANATVVATNEATGVTRATQSTSSGTYRFENLLVGVYDITVSADGFTKSETKGLTVNLNQTLTSNSTLTVGQTAVTTVEVTEAAAAIDTTTAQIQDSYSAKQLADLPSASGGQNGSGIINVSLLSAGVTSSGGSGYGTGPSVGGQRPTNNNYTLEGIDINSLAVTGPVVTVPNDAISEFSVLLNQFSPDFGHSSGGQFNQVVKSGTNEFHGMAYEYFQNRNLNAADNLDAVQGNPLHPRYDNNRFGGYFGGPIKRNKLFFFVDYEYNPLGQTASTGYFAPTAAGYNMLSSLPGINPTNLQQFQKYLGTAAVASPVSGLPNQSPVMIAPGPGSNQGLGTGVFAPGGVGALSLPVGMVSASLPAFNNAAFGVASVDYNISDKDSLRGRFISNRTGTEDTSGFPAEFFGITPTNSYVATLSEYHTFTPTLLNEFRLGYNRLNQNIPAFGNVSFPGLDQFPNVVVNELIAGYGPDASAPQFTIQNLYQLSDNVTWTKGKHTLKFGFDGWSAISPSSFTQRARGDYEWNYLSDYLYDTTPDYIAQRGLGNVTYYQNQQLLGSYLNDIWKVTSNLTVNLGLRYEYQTVPLGQNAQDLNASASVPGLITFKSPTAQATNFMPRVGIAYSPGTSGRTSIRAGFGITYDVLYNNLGGTTLPPQLNTTVDVTGKSATGFLANGGIPANASAAIPEGAAAIAATSGFVPNQRRPQAINWNFGIQHQFGSNYVFETRYVGTRGVFLPIQSQINVQPVVNSSNALPLFMSMPSQATLNSLTSNLTTLQNSLDNGGYILPAYANAGFVSPITAFMPQGNSIYHGWSNQLTRRFSHGLQFTGSYTWSHAIDDSTDTLASTVLTPRRPQNSQDLRIERGTSILDRRNRVVLSVIYDVPFFKSRNWFMKNLVGNWEFVPVYTYQTGQPVTAQSATDVNLNGDAAPDRTAINPLGNANVGTGVTALQNSNGDTVAYLADNPNARYIALDHGALPNAGRNTLNMNPTNNVDFSAVKRFSITERARLEFSVRAFNIFNHAQYTGGYLNDVFPYTGANSTIQLNALVPSSANFQQWSQAFSSNPRQLQLAVKFTF
jgi:hypothetical protein